MTGHKNKHKVTYRMSYWRPSSIMMGYGVFVGIVMLALIEQGFSNWIEWLDSIAFGVFLAALYSAIIVAHFRIGISSRGIDGHDVFGRRRFVPWALLESAKFINFAGLRYVRLFAEDGARPLWLPLFLSNQDEFERTVQHFAPGENTLPRYFKERTA